VLEIFEHFEQIAPRFVPVVLIGPGLVCVIAGLFLWLGGLGFRRTLVAVAGAVSGGVCGFFIIGRGFILAMVPAGVAAVVAVIFEKMFITILATALAVVIGIAVLARPHIEEAASLKQHPQNKIQKREQALSMQQTVETVKAYTADFRTELKQACLQMAGYKWVIIAVLVLTFTAAGFYFPRLTSALCCATSGTILIFAGMILLLLYKGSAPVSGICHRAPFYLGVFTVMIVFGTIEQLLLCRGVRRRPTRQKGKQQPEEKRQDWRTV